MRKLSTLEFEENGKTIIFTAVPLNEGENVQYQKYSFAVKDDDVLSQKLLSCVKSKSTTFNYLWDCAKALFNIIEENVFTILVTQKEYVTLEEMFYAECGEEPEFAVSNNSKDKHKPQFKSLLMNAESDEAFTGEGRTKQQACAIALQNYFAAQKKTRV